MDPKMRMAMQAAVESMGRAAKKGRAVRWQKKPEPAMEHPPEGTPDLTGLGEDGLARGNVDPAEKMSPQELEELMSGLQR